jgi:hypothetical protein
VVKVVQGPRIHRGTQKLLTVGSPCIMKQKENIGTCYLARLALAARNLAKVLVQREVVSNRVFPSRSGRFVVGKVVGNPRVDSGQRCHLVWRVDDG